MLNKVMIIGRLGCDPETKQTSAGPVCRLSVGAIEHGKARDGSTKEATEWFHVVAWGKLAEICGQYLRKGRQVYVEGPLRTRKYTDKSGVERYISEVIARTVDFIDSANTGKQEAGDSRAGTFPQKLEPSSDAMENIPF